MSKQMTRQQYIDWLIQRAQALGQDLTAYESQNDFSYASKGITPHDDRKAFATAFGQPRPGPDGPIEYELINA